MSNISLNTPIENIGALELDRASVLLSDDALEATAASQAAPTSVNNCGTVWPCARIDDGALENAAVTVTVGPTIAPCTVMTCPRRIDDGELETAAAMTASPSFDTVCASTIGRRCLRDSAN